MSHQRKVGIALGGGGAKGFAHVGVLQALESAGIECEIIAGTSIGALVGAAYAAGNLTALAEEGSNISLLDIPKLLGPIWPKQGFFHGEKALDFLCEFLPVEKIERLPKKFAAVSSDLISGERVEHLDGDIREAVRASISIPGLFTPVTKDKMLLVDGGLLEPVPVETTRNLGANFIIAVDLFGLPEDSSTLDTSSLSLREVLERTLALNQRELTLLRLADHAADFLIRPPVQDIRALDFHRGKPVIERCREATEKLLPELTALLGA